MSKFRLDEVDHQILDIDRYTRVPVHRYRKKIINFCWYRSR
jgi:hypothetical protein